MNTFSAAGRTSRLIMHAFSWRAYCRMTDMSQAAPGRAAWENRRVYRRRPTIVELCTLGSMNWTISSSVTRAIAVWSARPGQLSSVYRRSTLESASPLIVLAISPPFTSGANEERTEACAVATMADGLPTTHARVSQSTIAGGGPHRVAGGDPGQTSAARRDPWRGRTAPAHPGLVGSGSRFSRTAAPAASAHARAAGPSPCQP